MLQQGDQLGRYTIRRLLGKGGWGEVYEAHDPELGRPVAIKRVPRELAIDPAIRGRFEREARTVAALDHPNIVTIHSVEEDDGQRFITMQLVKGRALDRLIPPSGMPLEEIFRLAIPLADAVAAAHSRGVIHRDLKPANVMVTDEGHVKVLDFGLAKLTTQDDTETLIAEAKDAKTAAGSVLGTLTYMSPEQLRGEEADARSDIFSLGIILYQMATGKAPFGGRSSVEVAASILRDRPSAVSEIRAGIPRHLDRIIRHCLEEDPSRRFQSALDVRNELVHLRDEVESGEHPPSEPSLPVTPAARGALGRRWPVVAAAALMGLLLTLAVFLWVARDETPSGTAPAAPPAGTVRIVVLPFVDRGPPAVDYFSEAITEEINSRLAAVDGLGVISRISADQYAGSNKSARQIGDELGVAYILQGSVEWRPREGSAADVKIAPKLIRIEDDIEIWSVPYERTVDDIFDVQAEIAARVAEQLGQRLGRPGTVPASQPTANLEAYQAYLRGLHYARKPVYTMENLRQAIAGFAEAVQLDPQFAAASARLARSHALVFHLGLDTSDARQRLAREATQRAVELAADDPEVRLAVGYYEYEVAQDYERALEEFALAEQRLPSSSEVHEAKGYVLRRMGQWPEAIASLEIAFELSPRYSALAAEIGESHAMVRAYDDALRWYDQSIALDPDQVWAYVAKAWAHWLRDGDLAAARATLDKMPPTEDELATWAWFWQEIYAGHPEVALARLPADEGSWIQSWEWTQPAALLAAQALDIAGRTEAARGSYEAAAALLSEALADMPDDARLQSALGLAYAGLGRSAEALRHSRRAAKLQPLSRDAFSGTTFVADLALVCARSGRPAEAIDLLEELLARPALVSAAWLRLDPRWRPLRDEPRFGKLVR